MLRKSTLARTMKFQLQASKWIILLGALVLTSWVEPSHELDSPTTSTTTSGPLASLVGSTTKKPAPASTTIVPTTEQSNSTSTTTTTSEPPKVDIGAKVVALVRQGKFTEAKEELDSIEYESIEFYRMVRLLYHQEDDLHLVLRFVRFLRKDNDQIHKSFYMILAMVPKRPKESLGLKAEFDLKETLEWYVDEAPSKKLVHNAQIFIDSVDEYIIEYSAIKISEQLLQNDYTNLQKFTSEVYSQAGVLLPDVMRMVIAETYDKLGYTKLDEAIQTVEQREAHASLLVALADHLNKIDSKGESKDYAQVAEDIVKFQYDGVAASWARWIKMRFAQVRRQFPSTVEKKAHKMLF